MQVRDNLLLHLYNEVFFLMTIMVVSLLMICLYQNLNRIRK